MSRIINRQPDRTGNVLLGVLPFVLLALFYLIASEIRLEANPDDKLLPSLSSFAEAIKNVAVEPSRRSGEVVLWGDTLASLKRLGMGVGLAALAGLVFGIITGAVPYARAALSPLIAALSLIPPLAMLPILFILFGLGELAKVVLIVVGIAPFIMRELALRVTELPSEQIIKAQTLGASSWQVIIRVVLPQMLPRLIDAVRLALGPAWLFLIAAEAIAATDGVGYRIFLLRRYMAMDTILPYVAWITLMAFLLDWSLKLLSRKAFPWFHLGVNRT